MSVWQGLKYALEDQFAYLDITSIISHCISKLLKCLLWVPCLKINWKIIASTNIVAKWC